MKLRISRVREVDPSGWQYILTHDDDYDSAEHQLDELDRISDLPSTLRKILNSPGDYDSAEDQLADIKRVAGVR